MHMGEYEGTRHFLQTCFQPAGSSQSMTVAFDFVEGALTAIIMGSFYLPNIFVYLFTVIYVIHYCHSSDLGIKFPSSWQYIPSSPVLLHSLAEKEEEICKIFVRHLKSCDESKQTFPSGLAEYVNSYEETMGKFRYGHYNVSSRAVAVSWNPIASFRMIKRFVRTLKPLVSSLGGSHAEKRIQGNVLEIVNTTWPTESDLRESCSAILRLQHVHDLSTAEVANGLLDGDSSGLELTADDCNDLGRTGIFTEYYYLAIEWFHEGRTRIGKLQSEVKCSGQNLLENNLDFAAAAHDAVFQISEIWQSELFASKQRETSPAAQRYRRRTRELIKWRGWHGTNFNEVNYWGLCNGETYQSERLKSQLFCWYETKQNPAWTINPLKAELLSASPLILVQYYDIISDRTIKIIKKFVNSRMTRSGVFIDQSKNEIHPARTSVNTFVHDHESSTFKSIARTVELITGLQLVENDAAEALQVASYSPGGHYLVHLDPLHIERPGGDRIATFLFYLSDVLKGGGTAFPMAGVASKPIKGSAVFWYSLSRSGKIDDNSYHGACPVVLGEKWIGNKWIKVDAQMFSPDHKCLTVPDSRIEFRVNGSPLSGMINP